MSSQSLRMLREAITRNQESRRWEAGPGRLWRETEERFLAAVPHSHRSALRELLPEVAYRNPALHNWLCEVAWGDAYLPDYVPERLLQAYLSNPTVGLSDRCRTCRLDLPGGLACFDVCPNCGGVVGRGSSGSDASSAAEEVLEVTH